MCGIVGYFGESYRAKLQAALESISHRGPDGFGVYHLADQPVGLAHARLSILELSHAGKQPMLSDDGAVALVFNGEIYNFRELRRDLEAAGYSFRGNSDTEVLLKCYLAEGEAVLQRLNGIFALAIWDSRVDALFVARDALGVKPLYYSATDEGFIFASEIKALAALATSAFELDVSALNRYLTFLWCPGEGTPAESVRKVGPGEAMWVRGGRIQRHVKWYKLPVFQEKKLPSMQGDYIGRTRELLRAAVHRQMVSDVPVGAFLSGGLDSSAIVAFAQEVHPEIRCFTIEIDGGAEEGVSDDLPYARQVAAHLKVPLEVVRVDVATAAGDLAAMVAQLDEPLADPAAMNVFYISRLARQNGIKVLLSGVGGDDLFAGYRRHRALVSQEHWDWLPAWIWHGVDRAAAVLDVRDALSRRIRKLASGAMLRGDERLVNYFRWTDRSHLDALFSEDFRSRLRGDRAEEPLLEFLRQLPHSTGPLERLLALDQRFFLADHNLIYTDKMAMAVGVEVRVPFLDLDLVEFAAGLPPQLKQRGQTGKWVLRKAMAPYLPAEIISRPKTGFGAPLRRWIRSELRDLVADLLDESSLQNRGLFDPKAVQRLVQANDRGAVDGAYTIFALMSVELWCRRFLDGAVTPAVTSGFPGTSPSPWIVTSRS